MKPEIARPLRSLPAETRLAFETRYMVALAHGVHMLSCCLPENAPVRKISAQVAEITRCTAQNSYKPGDFDRLSSQASPDPEANIRLHAAVDLIWRAAAFQREPVRAALIELVSGFTEQRPLVV